MAFSVNECSRYFSVALRGLYVWHAQIQILNEISKKEDENMFIISKQDSYKMEPEETDRNFRKKGVIYLQYFTTRLIKSILK